MDTQHRAPGHATCTVKLVIKAAVPILILLLTFYVYFWDTHYWETIMVLLEPLYPSKMKLKNEPTKIPFREMSVDDIKHLIWNELPETGNFSSVKSSSSGRHSVVSLEQPRAQYCVGDTLAVLVSMKDYSGIPKTYGGDLLLARIHSPALQASASGEVTDLRNGSYRVRFRLSWPGFVQVSVLLAHSSEAIEILKRTGENNYNRVIFTGYFYNGKKKETSQCRTRLKANRALCEYGKKEDADYFACFPPKTLPCSALRGMSSRNNPISDLNKDEQSLLSKGRNGLQIKNRFGPVNVSSCPGKEILEPKEKCVVGFGMMSPSPSGYFFKNKWASTSCQNGDFFSADTISKCLKSRTLKIFGDSTVHQWLVAFINTLGLKSVKLRDVSAFYPTLAFGRNITIEWRMHRHPVVAHGETVLDAMVYIDREIDKVNDSAVVVIGVGQHFRPFPLEIFIKRLINIRMAILRLQERNPQALVIIKVENTREFYSPTIQLSNWFGYLQNLAQRKVFWDLKVVLVDAWDMTTAANTLYVHPNNIVVTNEIALGLSYVCHDG